LRLLKQDNRIVILVPPADVAAIARDFAEPGVHVEPIPGAKTRWEAGLAFVRRFLLANPARNRTISVFYSFMKKEQPFRYAVVRYVNPWLGRSRWLRELWLVIETKVNRGGEYRELFSTYGTIFPQRA